MNNLLQILEGKKTYIGIVVTIVGMTGLARFISDGEVTTVLNSIFEVVGVVVAVYGRRVAQV